MGADATCLSNGDLSTLQYLCRPMGSNKTENTKSWEDQRIGQQPSANIYTHIPNNNAAFGSKQDDPCTEFKSA